MKKKLFNLLSTIGGKCKYAYIKVFGMSEKDLRSYFSFGFNSAIESTLGVYQGKYLDRELNNSINEVYELYRNNVQLLSSVKRSVQHMYGLVLNEEYISSIIDIHTGKYRTDKNELNDTDKFRLTIREGFGDYLKRHLSKIITKKEFSLFEEMGLKGIIGAYRKSLKSNSELLKLKALFGIDYDIIIDEECNRAIEEYSELLSSFMASRDAYSRAFI